MPMIRKSLPNPNILIESMRAIGYSFESAVADIIDNSISAGCKNINIYFMPYENIFLAICDDGRGMSKHELEEAMRYGCKNPLEKRNEDDLGRFGLGLKAASLSQCRKLTVVSKKEGHLSAYSWDLDVISREQDWVLIEYSEDEIKQFPRIDYLNNQYNGTYVLWQNFDRVEITSKNLIDTLSNKINDTREYISLIFHRFISGGTKICINNNTVNALDPFLSEHVSTQPKKEQKINIKDRFGIEREIKIKPYVLPHHSKLSEQDILKVGGKENLRTKQGFYIYRNKRLIIWGTWFRLAGQDELSKLARVRVDIPNTLDDIWSIDIKKSSASLPDSIKKLLFAAVEDSVGTSKRTYLFRGRKENNNDNINYVWNIIKTRVGITYEINRKLPILDAISREVNKEALQMINILLNDIETCIPKTDIYNFMSTFTENKEENDESEQIYNKVKDLINIYKKVEDDTNIIIDKIFTSEPYCNYYQIKSKIKEELL